MILQRLYELAVRENLLDDPAFEVLPVPWVITVGEGGEYLGFNDNRGMQSVASKKKDAPPKQVKDKGQMMKVPRAHGNIANRGFARYFVDTLPRVLPLTVEENDQLKADASRITFWAQIDRAADETDEPALRAVQAFGRRLGEFTERIRADVAKEEPALTDRITFAYQPVVGPKLPELGPVRTWFAKFYAGVSANKQDAGPVGVCQVTGTIGPIPISHSTKLQGVPGGMSVGVSLISFDKPAFGHYGLDGAANAGIGYEATDGYLRALDALLKNALPTNKERGGKSKLVIGGTAFLFWTKEPRDTSFVSLLDDPIDDPLKVLLNSVHGGRNSAGSLDVEPFYLLGISGNSARAEVRGYLETTLIEAKKHVAGWFAHLRIADTSKDYYGKVNGKFPLWQLTLATAFDRESVAPDTEERLMFAALRGDPVPESVLIACLRRLAVEGSKGFRPSRMALIKLILNRKGVPVEPQLNTGETNAAYVYGRFLAVCEDIQRAALGKVNTNIVDRYYGRLSTAPAMILRRMIDGALDHLRRVRTIKESLHAHLDRRLAEVVRLMPADPLTGQMSFEDQARFSIGYYHEKAASYTRIADRKRRKANEEERKRAAEAEKKVNNS